MTLILDNAKEIFIDGKSVKKISINDSIVWRKPLNNNVTRLILESYKSILSGYHNDECVLTVTAYNGDLIAEGVPVFFNIIDGDGAIIDGIGNGVTDANGKCSVVYSAKSDGDVKVQCSSGSILSQICELEDCFFWDDCSSDKLNDYIGNIHDAPVEYITSMVRFMETSSMKMVLLDTSNSYGFVGGGGSKLFNQLQVPVEGLFDNVCFSADILFTNRGSNNVGIWIADRLISSSLDWNGLNGYGLEQYSGNKGVIKYTDGYSSNLMRGVPNLNNYEWYTFTIQLFDGQISFKIVRKSDNTLVFSYSSTYVPTFPIRFLLSNWEKGQFYYKNIKLKRYF